MIRYSPSAEPFGKTCAQCRMDRPIGRFPRCKHTPNGRLDKCMDCITASAQRDRIAREQQRAAP